MGRRESLKMIRSGTETLTHRILNDIAASVRAEAKERAHTDLPEPTNKSARPGQVAVSMVFSGEVSERDRGAMRDIMQKLKNPAELMDLLNKHGKN